MNNEIQNQLKEALPSLHSLLKNPNVVGLHIGTEINADKINETVLILSVKKLSANLKGGKYFIPHEVDVAPLIGKIKIVIRETGAAKVQTLDKHMRPCPGGYQIIVDTAVGFGTLGVNIDYKGTYRLLSCAHVIAPDSSFIGKSLYQPDPGLFNQHNISKVTGRMEVITYDSEPVSPIFNQYDFAWSDIGKDKGDAQIALMNITPAGYRAPVKGEEIKVVGKQTGKICTAIIADISSTLQTTFYKKQIAFFKDLIQLDRLVTRAGDSGAVYLATTDNMIVGIHCLATKTNSYGCQVPA